jgi:hypothetical protein
MNKCLLVLIAAFVTFIFVGCTSEFYKHDRVFATNKHVAYSWWGYKNTNAQDAKLSASQGWWGKTIPYTPAK